MGIKKVTTVKKVAPVKRKMFKCDQCDQTAETKIFLNMHKREHVKETKILAAEKRSKVYVKCQVCGSTFDNENRLKKHNHTEHGNGKKSTEAEVEVENESPERKKAKQEEITANKAYDDDTEAKIDSTLEDKEPEASLDEQLLVSYKSENGNHKEIIKNQKEIIKTMTEEQHKLNKQIQMINKRAADLEDYGDEVRERYDNLKISYTKMDYDNEKMGEYILKAERTIRELKGFPEFLQTEEEESSEVEVTLVEEAAPQEESEEEMEETIIEKTEQKERVKCTKCNFKTSSEEEKMRHMKNHTEIETLPIKCEQCDLKFLSQTKKRVHIKDKHTVKSQQYNCHSCQFQGKDGADLINHMNSTGHKVPSAPQLEETFKCKDCSLVFSNFSDMMYHRKVKHTKKVCRNLPNCSWKERCWWLHPTEEPMETNTQEGELNFKCSSCGDCSNSKANMMMHKKVMHHRTVSSCRDFPRCTRTDERCWFLHSTTPAPATTPSPTGIYDVDSG